MLVKNHCPKLKACAKMDILKNAKNRQKSQNQDFEPHSQANYSLYKQTFDVFRKNTIRYCYHEDFMKKY